MNQHPTSPDPNLLKRWNALLDGEVPASEASALRASEGADWFLPSMEAFNAALKRAANDGIPQHAPGALQSKLRDLIETEQSLRLMRGGARPSPARAAILKLPVWRAAVAAVVLVALSIGGTLVVSGSLDQPRSGFTGRMINANVNDPRITELSKVGSEFLLELGTQNQGEVRQMLVRQHFGDALPQAGSVAGYRLNPVNVRVGRTAAGLDYRAVTYCTGPVSVGDDPSAGKALRRCVLFIVKGNAVPEGWEPNTFGGYRFQAYGFQMMGRYNEAFDESYIVYIPLSDAERAREMAAPLIDF